jgi:hypothetical protein
MIGCREAAAAREAAKPFVALQHYFEHGHTGGNDPLTITRDDLRKLARSMSVFVACQLHRTERRATWRGRYEMGDPGRINVGQIASA